MEDEIFKGNAILLDRNAIGFSLHARPKVTIHIAGNHQLGAKKRNILAAA
jgi:hypothetical protein